MKKKSIILVALMALVLSGCNPLKKASDAVVGGGGNQAGKDFTGSLKAAVALGVPMKCTYTDNSGVEVESFVKGENYYTEMNQDGKAGYMVMKDKCMWAWGEDEPQGMTMCYEEGSIFDVDEEAQEGMEEYSNYNPDVEYRCRPAAITDAKFAIPDEVEFVDLAAMMQMFGGGMMGGDDGEDATETSEDVEFDQEQLEQMMQQFGQ